MAREQGQSDSLSERARAERLNSCLAAASSVAEVADAMLIAVREVGRDLVNADLVGDDDVAVGLIVPADAGRISGPVDQTFGDAGCMATPARVAEVTSTLTPWAGAQNLRLIPVIDRSRCVAVIAVRADPLTDASEFDRLVRAVALIGLVAAMRLSSAIELERLRHRAQSTGSPETSQRTTEGSARATQDSSRPEHAGVLLDRRGFEDIVSRRLTEVFSLDGDEDRGLSIAIGDVDNLRSINETYGHEAGDLVIEGVGRLIRELAPCDLCHAAQLSGDEFGLLAPDRETLTRWVLSVLGGVRSSEWRSRSTPMPVSISFGVTFDTETATWDAADTALRIAKDQGGDQMVVHDDASPKIVALIGDRSWAESITAALEEDRFVLYGQPIVHTSQPQSAPVWFEMLLRYRSRAGVVAAPDSFLPSARRFGLMGQIDSWTTERAISWLGGTPPQTRAAVNVAGSFLASPRSLTHIGHALANHSVDPSRLCIEITETTAIEDFRRTRDVIRTLRGWGCSVAIDDFGNGWTSLPLVRDLEVDLLKIDGRWVRSALVDDLSNAVVTAIVEAASIIGAKVVGEWVEDAATIEFLHLLGVDFAQGYLTGVPAPLDSYVLTNHAEPHAAAGVPVDRPTLPAVPFDVPRRARIADHRVPDFGVAEVTGSAAVLGPTA